MIEPSIIAEARRLLAERRTSQRDIALRLGISRGTVGRLASGARPDYGNLSTGEEVRCTGCGGLVVMPCRACRDLAAKSKRRPSGATAEREEPTLQLRPEDRARYEGIRQAREVAGNRVAGHELASFAVSHEDQPIDEHPADQSPQAA